MAKNPLIRSYSKRVNKPLPNKSAGILDDFAVRKNVCTKDGTIEHTPASDNDIANKKYVDDEIHWNRTGTSVHLKTSTDSVGIGTSTPSQKLEVDGHILSLSLHSHDGITFLGYDSAKDNTGTLLTSFGKNSAKSNTGNSVVSIGYGSGGSNKGNNCTFLGYGAGVFNDGNNVNAFGYSAVTFNDGHYCQFFGDSAGRSNTGDYCSGFGFEALRSNTGDNCVAMGDQSGEGNTTASQFIVKQTRVNATPLIQGDFSTGKVGIGVADAHSKLEVAGAISSKSKSFSTAGPTDNVDVSDVNILFVDSYYGSVTIGGFAGGVAGQVLHIAKKYTNNDVTLEHNEGGGSQNIYLHVGADETLSGERGGWTLVCDGYHWYDVSHARHV